MGDHPQTLLSSPFPYNPSREISQDISVRHRIEEDRGSNIISSLLTDALHQPTQSNDEGSLQDCLPAATRHDDDGTPLLENLARTHAWQQARTNARRWHPHFLQRSVFYAFIAVFAALIITLESGFAISERYQGLATATENTSYVWAYSPAALFALLAAIWTCTEYTAKAIAPWIESQTASDNVDHRNPLILDYISMFSPSVPFKALRNRDYIVAAGASISQLLSILTITAPSLLKLTSIDLDHSVTVTSQFTNTSLLLSEVGLMPLYASIGIRRYQLHYPSGTLDQLIYQTIAQSTQSTTNLQATIAGLSVDIDCHDAILDSFNLSQVTADNNDTQLFLTMNLSTADCYMSISILLTATTTIFGRLLSGSCINASSAQQENKRLAYFFGEIDIALDIATNSVSGTSLLRSTQVLCKPSYNVSNYEIFQTMGHIPELSLAQDPQTRKLDNLREWDFAQAMIDTSSSVQPVITFEFYVLSTIEVEDLDPNSTFIDLDFYSTAILGFSSKLVTESSSIFNASLIASCLRAYYHVHAVFLAHSALIEPTSSEVPGNVQIRSSRLIVQALPCHFMATICLLAIVILSTTIRFIPCHLSLAGDPGTILGIVELTKKISHSFPQGLSSKDSKTADRMVKDTSLWRNRVHTNRNELDEDHITFLRHLHKDRQFLSISTGLLPKLYQPLSLRTASRSLICFLLIAAILTLEILLNKSVKSQGIGEVSTSTYTHYLWTILPATILSLIGTIISSVDLEYRIIAPYYALSRAPTSASVSLNQKLLGLLAPHALYTQLKASNYGGIMATGAAIVSSFFSVTAGSLFFESSTFTTPAQLQFAGSFTSDLYAPGYDIIFGLNTGTGIGAFDFGIISTLILENNLSYPAFTYEGLAFPMLTWVNDQSSEWLNISNLIAQVTIPALESGLTCYIYNESEITSEIVFVDPEKEPKFGEPEWPAGNRILVNVTGNYCRNGYYNGTSSDLSATAAFFINDTITPNGGVFATSTTTSKGGIFETCQHQYFYIWGGFSGSDSPTVSASAAICNASVSAVDVEVVFSGPELIISENQPPRRIENTAREIMLANDSTVEYGNSVYQELYSLPVEKGYLLDPFFSILTTSRYAIPISSFADRTQDDKVVEAIIFHHNIIIAQTLSSTARVGAGQPNSTDLGVFERTGQGRVNDTFSASIVGNPGNLSSRVLQNKIATRVLEAMLATTLVLTILSWYFGPRGGILPRPPTSIASVLAMLVDGNIFSLCEEIPGKVNETDLSKVVQMAGGMRLFRLGGGDDERRFGIYVSDGNSLLKARDFKAGSADRPINSSSHWSVNNSMYEQLGATSS
ncbi:hypothetical protein F5Y12DRAFT_763698 [Xylaria sp. FL1777]|nr:hypothetical protein F5Y12DRAFT_763698 [Xylaria sp. FL1777]